MSELTPRQRFVLDWLGSNPQSRSRWMRDGKNAFGHPKDWDSIEISGKQGSIIVEASDWTALHDFVEIADPESDKMFIPRVAISSGERGSS